MSSNKIRKNIYIVLLITFTSGLLLLFTNASSSTTPTAPVLSTMLPPIACGTEIVQPFVTHINNAKLSFEEGSTDLPCTILKNGKYVLDPACNAPADGHYRSYPFGFLPEYEKYVGTYYSSSVWPANQHSEWVRGFCSSHYPVEYLNPPARKFSEAGWVAAKSVLQARRGSIQILGSLITEKSMTAIILPPDYDPSAPEGTYAILFNGFYGLRSGLEADGSVIIRAMARLYRGSGKKFIGIVWNGGGDQASGTTGDPALVEFNKIIQIVAKNYGGDSQRIVTFGASRGGSTALRMAANPLRFPYKVKAAYAAVAPADYKLLTDLSSTPTVPSLLAYANYSIGLGSTLAKNWRYPFKNTLYGLTRVQASLKAGVGTYDISAINNRFSLNSPRYMEALKKTGTKVFLEMGSHDALVPWLDQFLFAKTLDKYGIPNQQLVSYMAGHTRTNDIDTTTRKAIEAVIDGKPLIFNIQDKSYRRVLSTGKVVNIDKTRGPRFTLELPRYLAADDNAFIIATGVADTMFELIGFNAVDNSPFNFKAALDANGQYSGDISAIAVGKYNITEVWIQKPGQLRVQLGYTHRTSILRGPLVIEKTRDRFPATDSQHQKTVHDLYLGDSNQYANGAYTTVTYGIVEE